MEIKALCEGLHCYVVQQRAFPPERAILMPFPWKVHTCSVERTLSFLLVAYCGCVKVIAFMKLSFLHRNFKKNFIFIPFSESLTVTGIRILGMDSIFMGSDTKRLRNIDGKQRPFHIWNVHYVGFGSKGWIKTTSHSGHWSELCALTTRKVSKERAREVKRVRLFQVS